MNKKYYTEVVFAEDFKDVSRYFEDLADKKLNVFATRSWSNTEVDRLTDCFPLATDCSVRFVDDGEECKNVRTVLDFVNAFVEDGVTRSDVIINLGGGTVCDLGGFIASIYKRGISYYNIPTTLLCAVDACVGGKTGIDACGVKNLLGTFYHPVRSFIIKRIIEELPDSLIEDGKSEIIKYAVIDEEFRNYLGTGTPRDFRLRLFEIVKKCIEIKQRFVLADEKDVGERRLLNAGHTIAHAIEAGSGYRISHSAAVKTGLVCETDIAFRAGYIDKCEYDDLCSLYDGYFGKTESLSGNDMCSLIRYMKNDKKNENNRICLVLPYGKTVRPCYFSEEEFVKLFCK